MLALFAILAWAAPFLAQDDAQTCSFALSSDGSLLGQVDSGQVVGTPEAHGSSAEESGTVFHLRGGGLYDAAMRGCWWPGKHDYSELPSFTSLVVRKPPITTHPSLPSLLQTKQVPTYTTT
jgi:hypothetical protein